MSKTINFTKDFERNLNSYMNNLIKQINGKLNINIKLIRNDLDKFNIKYGTSFNANTTDDEIKNFFQNEYKHLLTELKDKKLNIKQFFNLKYNPYATLE